MIDVVFTGAVPAPLSKPLLTRAIRLAFEVTRKRQRGSVSVVFLTEGRIRALNRKWRRIDRSTDVLSFSPSADIPLGRETKNAWGDLFLASAYIRREARRRAIDFSEELLRVLIHGMLHLFGYDHATAAEEKRMFGLQERALAKTLKRV